MPPIEFKRHYYVKDMRTPNKGECCTLGGDVRVRDLVCSLQLGTPRGTLEVRLIFVCLTPQGSAHANINLFFFADFLESRAGLY